MVHWDRLNNGKVRLSVGAVAVETGNFRYFDTTCDTIDARHILASGALPPGLPPVEIDGHWRSEEHTSELQSLMRISYAVFCLKKKKTSSEKNQSANQSLMSKTSMYYLL